jgi:hypothetical protein
MGVLAMRSLILGVLLLTAGVAHAGTTRVSGLGTDSCGRLIAAVGSVPPGKFRSRDTASGVFVNEYAQYQEWLMGFVSGFNAMHEEEQQVSVDLAGLDLWMRNWCNKHPAQKVFHGALAFIDEMRSNAAAK